MSSDSIVGAVAFVFIFGLEYAFPFFRYSGMRGKHAAVNLSLALVNAVIAFALAGMMLFGMEFFNQKFSGILSVSRNNDIGKIILGIFLFDLWMYAWHRLNHEVPFLWRFHRVHHTDPAMDSSTAFRFHPVELVMSYFFNILVLGLLGLNLSFLVFYRVILLPVIIFHHSNVAVPRKWDFHLCRMIVMPGMHRVHHSEIYEETNSSYGSIFSFWDRLFGSFRVKEDPKSIVFGIGKYKGPKSQRFLGLLLVPFRG